MTNVGTYMTLAPHTIGIEQSLAMARRLMSEHHVRHLPVLHGGELVGVLSEREVEAFEVLPGSRQLTVEEAMVPDVYVTFRETPLGDVADEMAPSRGLRGRRAAPRGTKVLGVFTAEDALRALADALRSPPAIAA